VILERSQLPTGFHHAGDIPAQSKLAKAQPAHLEFPQKAAWPAADAAAIAVPSLKLRLPHQFCHL
jgi:hypothetical protein